MSIIEREIKNYYKIITALVVAIVLIVVVLPSLLVTKSQANFALANNIAAEETEKWDMGESNGEVQGLTDTDKLNDFQLIIPKAGVNHHVVANVNPGKQSVYGPVIEQNIAHGKYTLLPDEATERGNVYLFAHREGNIDGRDIGYFRHLDKMSAGDQATIRYAGRTYTYEFVTKFVISPKDTAVYTPNSKYPALTLQTCENGVENRLIVRFKLVSVK